MTKTTYDLAHWGISIGVPAFSGLIGVMLGAWLTGRRETKQRQLAFVENQLRNFYSPLLGIRSEIQMQSELRVKISQTANVEWRKWVSGIGAVEAQKLTEERFKEFKQIIEYDNRQFREELMPAYLKMVSLFRDNMWLTEPETRKYFKPLLEFVEVWNRFLAKSLPVEVVQAINHGEESLKPFYEHLQNKHDELRKKLENVKV